MYRSKLPDPYPYESPENFKIWACYSVFNTNPVFFQASLEIIQHYVDRILIVDGRYEKYPGELANWKGNRSTNGTLEVAQLFQDKLGEDRVFIITASTPFPDQVTKRNVYVDFIPEGDWFFIIDGDELPFGSLEFLRDLLRVERYHAVNVLEVYQDLLTMQGKIRGRIIRKLPGLKYELCHFSIFHHGKMVCGHPAYMQVQKIYPIQLIHLKNHQNNEIKKMKREWRKISIKHGN